MIFSSGLCIRISNVTFVPGHFFSEAPATTASFPVNPAMPHAQLVDLNSAQRHLCRLYGKKYPKQHLPVGVPIFFTLRYGELVHLLGGTQTGRCRKRSQSLYLKERFGAYKVSKIPSERGRSYPYRFPSTSWYSFFLSDV